MAFDVGDGGSGARVLDLQPGRRRGVSVRSGAGVAGRRPRRGVRRLPHGLVLAHDLPCRLVLAQAEVDGVAQAPVRGPLAERHLGHQPGLAEDRPARGAGAGEGRALARQRLEQRTQAVELALAEAAAHAPDVAQRAVGLVHPEQQRADAPAAVALAGEPPPDDELLAAGTLDLQPLAGAPAGLVDGAHALGEHTLEALLGGGLQQLRGRGPRGTRAPAGSSPPSSSPASRSRRAL